VFKTKKGHLTLVSRKTK